MFTYSKQNSKLGKITNFSFSPVKTCVQDCNYCYAKKSFRQYKNVRNCWNNNSNYILKHNFFPDIPTNKINKNKIVRFLVAGDFQKVIVLNSFIDFCKRYNDFKFFGFTKTWIKSNYLESLHELNNLHNVNLFLSVDKQTKYNFPKGFNIAITSLESQINYSNYKKHFKDMIFKTCKHATDKINCDTCLLCVNHKINMLFPIH